MTNMNKFLQTLVVLLLLGSLGRLRSASLLFDEEDILLIPTRPVPPPLILASRGSALLN